MPREDQSPKGEKRNAILQAALELIVEQGLQHTPMSLISKRSGASAGIIYHYFASKEELLASLYQQIKGEMGRTLVATDDPKQPLAKRFQTVWIATFRYGLGHPQELAFLAQYENTPEAKQQQVWLQEETSTLDALEHLPFEAKVLYGLIADLRAQGLLKDLPLVVIGELTFGVAFRLARQAAAGLMPHDEGTLTEMAQACWDAIAR